MKRVRIVIGAVLAVLPWAAFAAEPDLSNAACIDRIDLPAYPLLATQARVSGTVIARAVLGSQARLERIEYTVAPDTRPVNRLLGPAVEAALRKAIFKPDCGGRVVEVVVAFQLQGATREKPKMSASYGFPNRFWIVSEAPMWQPSGYVSKARNGS